MAPPPPLKFGQRELFNDSFLSFLRRPNKSQLVAPPGVPNSPDSQDPMPMPMVHAQSNGRHRDEDAGEKKAMWLDGQQLLDRTKDLLEMGSRALGKDTTKRFRKEAARLTKNAPSKSKLPKKSLDDIAAFQQAAKAIYQEVENILRELENHHHPGGYPGDPQPHPEHVEQPHSRSESPPPLPRKPPSPKVTFNAEMKHESNVDLSRKASTRHGTEQQHMMEIARQESTKHSSSSRKEADLARSTSQRAPDQDRSRKYDKEDDKYRYRDEPKRSDSRPYTSDDNRDRDRDKKYYGSRDREYRSSHSRQYSDSRDKDYYESRSRKYDDRRYDDRDRERYRRDDKDDRKGESSRSDPPLRVVHEDAPLSAAHGGAGGVAFSPTYVPYPQDDSERRRRERDKERERERAERYRDRNRERPRDSDRERERERERERDRDRDYDRDRRRERDRRDDEYYRSRDKHKSSSRRYDDEYKSSRRGHDSREYPDDRDKYRDGERDRDRDKDRDRPREKERERERDRERDRDPDRDRDRERYKGRERERDKDRERGDRDKKEHIEQPPHSHHEEEDPSHSKFQEVFSPPEHATGGLPPSEGHA